MAIGNGFERGLEVSVGVDVVHPGRFGQGGDAGLGRRTLVMADEQGILAIQCQRPYGVFHQIIVHLHASVVEEHPQPVPKGCRCRPASRPGAIWVRPEARGLRILGDHARHQSRPSYKASNCALVSRITPL